MMDALLVAVIDAGIVIDQVLGKVALAPAPIDIQIFGQEGGDDQSDSIMRKTGGIQFTHFGVHYRKAGFSFAPGLIIIAIIIPVQVGKFFRKICGKW